MSGAQREVLDSCVQLLMDGGKENLDELERSRRNAHTDVAEDEDEGGLDGDSDARLRALHDLTQGGTPGATAGRTKMTSCLCKRPSRINGRASAQT